MINGLKINRMVSLEVNSPKSSAEQIRKIKVKKIFDSLIGIGIFWDADDADRAD